MCPWTMMSYIVIAMWTHGWLAAWLRPSTVKRNSIKFVCTIDRTQRRHHSACCVDCRCRWRRGENFHHLPPRQYIPLNVVVFVCVPSDIHAHTPYMAKYLISNYGVSHFVHTQFRQQMCVYRSRIAFREGLHI